MEDVLSAFMFMVWTLIGQPGQLTTLGMILAGALLGWLPYLVEQMAKPTPRERVCTNGWAGTLTSVKNEQGYRRFKSVFWATGLIAVIFGAVPLAALSSDEVLSGGVKFLGVYLPVGIGVLILLRLITKAVKNGHLRGDRDYRHAVSSPDYEVPPELRQRMSEDGIKAFSPLGRLLSEAERVRDDRS